MDRNVYSGIFADEVGQQLLNHSLAQIDATLGTAWAATEHKEDRVAVFGKCLDLVGTSFNEKTFADEAATTFQAQPRAAECWRGSFEAYVRQAIAANTKARIRGTVPGEAAYVQALLTVASRSAFVRSGAYFSCDSPLDRKDAAMDIVRQALAQLCLEYVYEEEEAAEAAIAPAHAASECASEEVGPEDSASQVGDREAHHHHHHRHHNSHTDHHRSHGEGHHYRSHGEGHREPHRHHEGDRRRHGSRSPHRHRSPPRDDRSSSHTASSRTASSVSSYASQLKTVDVATTAGR